ncbi:hypothetical protein BDY24DRAFT_412220 [Mrakia frigida]|uniref:O-fucosyltransferase family protein n=1 Tax=Mrakia frigida TaxID=29902 RepID=UPI003FCBF347
MASSSSSYSSRPLLSARSFSGPLSPSKASPRSPPTPSSKFKVSNRLKRPHKGLLVLLLCFFGVVVVSYGVSEEGNGWYSWRWKTRTKASAGLIKEGGRRGQNESYTENLLPDVNYLTSFHMAGLNNQVLIQFNLLHLTHLLRTNGPSPTPYTPIIPPFFPHFHHLRAGQGPSLAPVLRFSQVFDIDRLAEEVGWGIVEWSELKEGFEGKEYREDYAGVVQSEWATEEERRIASEGVKVQDVKIMGEGVEPETLGCWSIWQTSHKGGDLGMRNALQYYNLKPTFTPLPLSLFAPTDRSPRHLLLPSTANFLSPPDNRLRRDYLSFESGEAEQIVKSWEKNQSLVDVFGKPGWVEPSSKPGEVTCFDNLYFASDKGDEVREAFEGKDSGAWSSVGRHAHWNSDLKRLSVDILREVLQLPPGKLVPKIFTIHIRRTDFLDACPDYAKPCLGVSDFANHISNIRQEFIDEGRSDSKSWPVVVTTDERDPKYLAELTSLGWTLVDHAALRKTHGIWFPALVDNVLLSLGQGFVGTATSTMSILAARRVEDWNGGKAQLVGLMEGFFEREKNH